MSPASIHQFARRRLDQAIRRGLHQLRRDGRAQRALQRLLVDARERSTLLRPTHRGHRDLMAVRALVRLARHHRDHVRSSALWCGGDGSSYRLLGSLAAHVVGSYPTPPVLTSAWLMADGHEANVVRRWFIEHARGRPFRDVTGLPIAMTRRMEHIFLRSPADLPLPTALRRAEILGLDGPPALVDAVAGTELTRSLHDAGFWRSAIHFFIRHWDELRAQRVAELIEAVARLKLRERVVTTPAGRMRVPPPFPDFSLEGRTPRSLDRFIQRAQRPVTPPPAVGDSWSASGLAGFEMQDAARPEGAVRWQIVELLGASELRSEGQRLRHCVGGYVHACVSGRSSIWSLRFARGDDEPRSSYTIEVDPRSRRVVQIRGLRNRRVGGRPAWVIALWAQSQQLAVNEGA